MPATGGSRLCAVPAEHVVETMRPLPVVPVAGAPAFVLGVAVVRGEAVPVVDVGRLFDPGARAHPTRFVTVRVGARYAALAVDAVVGVRALAATDISALPPLLRDAGGDAVAQIGTRDGELLVVLQSARVVPEAVWAALESGAARA